MCVSSMTMTTTTTMEMIIICCHRGRKWWWQQLSSIEAIFNNFVEISQSPISHVYLYDFWKFLDKVRCSYPPNWPTIDPNLSSNFNSVDQKLKYSLSVYHLLCWDQIRREEALLTFSVASIVPNKDIRVSPQEKFKPVSVWAVNHPLIDQGIWITHYYCRPS